ncbi:thiamine pyrophosphate-binding protein [Streptomyces sp. NPDC047081]|uniref:thiamine pyrophosphate-binding protein n=1 Tax=Streptomyces sp. NPDC047081 TaxID=3154706 RepID=UPI0033D19BB5
MNEPPPVAPATTADALAVTIAGYGVRHVFGLMGDGNMHLFTALSQHGVQVVEVRHESAAVAMAEGYGWTSDAIGFCSVTHGPGLTHTATSLVVAARNHSPLVLLLAETPEGYEGAQHFDQELFVRACEAPYRRLRADDDPVSVLAERVALATDLSRPVVLAVPADLFTSAPGTTPAPPGTRSVRRPVEEDDRVAARELARALSRAERPVLIAGRGTLTGDTATLMTRLAERHGAALATTVPAKGMFDQHPYNLGISGGLSHRRAEEVLRAADLVVAVGSSLDRGTTSSMRLFRDATVVQVVDEEAGGPVHPNVRRLFGDAERVLSGCLAAPGPVPVAGHWFEPVPPPAKCWEEDLTDFDPPIEAGTVDPRRALAVISEALPGDAVVVVGNGHCSGFATTFVQVPAVGRFFAAHGFGSIGQALPSAVGAALGSPGHKVVVFEGDAAFMMHLQEVETAARVGADVTAFVLNDQALGTEYQRLLAEGADAELAAVSTPDLAAAAGALGARGRVIADASAVDACARDALAPGLAVVEVRVARSVLSRHMRRLRRAVAVPGSSMD